MWIRVDLPDEVHRELKSQAALNGESLLSWIRELLTQAASVTEPTTKAVNE